MLIVVCFACWLAGVIAGWWYRGIVMARSETAAWKREGERLKTLRLLPAAPGRDFSRWN